MIVIIHGMMIAGIVTKGDRTMSYRAIPNCATCRYCKHEKWKIVCMKLNPELWQILVGKSKCDCWQRRENHEL